MTKIQLDIETLKSLVKKAKHKRQFDNTLSQTLVFTLLNESETHLGNDNIEVWQNSGFSDLVGEKLDEI